MAKIVTPGGAKINDAVPGELAFMVGIQANESGFDYYRPGGSGPGYVTTDPEGFFASNNIPQDLQSMGAYQFQKGTDQYNQAAAANWNPASQDRIADSLIKGYYNAYGGAGNPNVWADVTEAWYGPATVGTPENDVLTNPSAPSSSDWANVQAALGGTPGLPPGGWVYGPDQGQHPTLAGIQKELQTGALPAGSYPTSPGIGTVASGTQASSAGSSGSSAPAKPWGGAFGSQIEEAAFFLLGLALVIVGLVIMFKDSGGGEQQEEAPSPREAAELAAEG